MLQQRTLSPACLPWPAVCPRRQLGTRTSGASACDARPVDLHGAFPRPPGESLLVLALHVFGVVLALFGVVFDLFGFVPALFGVVLALFGVVLELFGFVPAQFGVVLALRGCDLVWCRLKYCDYHSGSD
jgi:hypothetical protein